MRGVTLRLIDTPGLQPSSADIQHNSKIMADAKRFTRKHKPDIVLYFDRMDQPARSDAADLPLLKTVTGAAGPAIWFNAIVVLTHGSSAPPDGPNGQPISYEMYFAQRSHLVQQTIRQAAGDARPDEPGGAGEPPAVPYEPRRRTRVTQRPSVDPAAFVAVLREQDPHRGTLC